jgi:hypothetical protein
MRRDFQGTICDPAIGKFVVVRHIAFEQSSKHCLMHAAGSKNLTPSVQNCTALTGGARRGGYRSTQSPVASYFSKLLLN